MKRSSRFITCAAVLAASTLALSACAQDGSDDGTGVVRYLSYWTEDEPTAKIMAEAISDFEAETGVKVEVTWQGRDSPTVLTPRLSSSDPGVDLVDFNCNLVNSNLASVGRAADLASVLDMPVPGEDKTVNEVLSSAAVESGSNDELTFCVPFEVTSNFDIWYNQATHPELSNASTATWNEFKGLLDDAGPGSLAMDGTIPAYVAAWYMNLALSLTGPGGVLAAAEDKTGKAFEAPEFLEAAEAFSELVDGGYFTPGYDASKFPALQQKWANNEAQYILNGSWLPAEVAPYAAPGFEASSLAFPALDGGIRPMQVDAIGFAAINDSPNLESAEQFMAFFLQPKYQDQIGQIAIPARTDTTPAANLSNVTESLRDDSITKVQPFDGIVLPGWSDKVLNPAAQKLAFGQLDARGFIDELVAASKTYWEQEG